jgi:hypothetical protein
MLYNAHNSEKETTHSATHYALTVAKYVEFGDKLVKVVTCFGNGCQIGLQQDIIVLLQDKRKQD